MAGRTLLLIGSLALLAVGAGCGDKGERAGSPRDTILDLARNAGDSELVARLETALADGNAATYEITDAAMRPALAAGDRILAIPLAADEPARGDVVVFEPTAGARSDCGSRDGVIYVKRVIGLSGEEITYRSGRVRVDGKAVDDTTNFNGQRAKYPIAKVPSNNIYVLGDNRNASCDSAIWRDPYLPIANVRWVAVAVYAPADRVRLLTSR